MKNRKCIVHKLRKENILSNTLFKRFIFPFPFSAHHSFFVLEAAVRGRTPRIVRRTHQTTKSSSRRPVCGSVFLASSSILKPPTSLITLSSALSIAYLADRWIKYPGTGEKT